MVYGLKQAVLQWRAKVFTFFVQDPELKPLHADRGVVMGVAEDAIVVIAVYVNTCQSKYVLNSVQFALFKYFHVKKFCRPCLVSGCDIHRDGANCVLLFSQSL